MVITNSTKNLRIYIDGYSDITVSAYSYNTLIGNLRIKEGEGIIENWINDNYYSKTTRKHKGYIIGLFYTLATIYKAECIDGVRWELSLIKDWKSLQGYYFNSDMLKRIGQNL